MKWIKNILKRRDNTQDIDDTKTEDNIITEDGDACDYCGFEIFGEQKSIKKAGKRYQTKPCWRIIQKMAKKQAFG